MREYFLKNLVLKRETYTIPAIRDLKKEFYPLN